MGLIPVTLDVLVMSIFNFFLFKSSFNQKNNFFFLYNFLFKNFLFYILDLLLIFFLKNNKLKGNNLFMLKVDQIKNRNTFKIENKNVNDSYIKIIFRTFRDLSI